MPTRMPARACHRGSTPVRKATAAVPQTTSELRTSITPTNEHTTDSTPVSGAQRSQSGFMQSLLVVLLIGSTVRRSGASVVGGAGDLSVGRAADPRGRGIGRPADDTAAPAVYL